MFRRAQRLFRGMGKPDVPRMLQRANQLMTAGDFENAAIAFKDLAQPAEDRFPQHAPFLYMEAGHAAILSGQTKIGVAHLRRAMQAFGQRAIDELTGRNLNTEAEEIASLLRGNLPKEIPTEQPANTRRPILPTHCPACGAAVRPNEIEWLDEVTAECDYCGRPVRGNS